MSGVIRIILDYPGLSRFWIILDMFGYIRIIRVYGMEGAAAEEGEAQTRNIESSYRRPGACRFWPRNAFTCSAGADLGRAAEKPVVADR